MHSPYKPTASENHEACKKCLLYTNCEHPFMRGWSDYQTNTSSAGISAAVEEMKFGKKVIKTLLVVGEAPGVQEDNAGTPFVGESGKLLKRALKNTVDIHQTLFTNAVRCRPQGNKLVSTKPVKYCREFIKAEIELLKPAAMLLLGNTALNSVMQTSGITKKRRRQMTYRCEDGTEIPTMAAFHPAYALRDRNQLPAFTRDIEYFGRMVNGVLSDEASDIAADCDLYAGGATLTTLAEKWAAEEAVVAFDVETNSLFPHLAGEDFKVFCCGLSTGYDGGSDETVVVRLDQPDGVPPVALDALMSLLTNPKIKLAAHNAKYDARAIKHRFGVTVHPHIDTMLMHTTLYPRRGEHDLKSIASELLDVSGYEDVIAKHSSSAKSALINDWGTIPYDTLAKYCATDCIVTAQLCKVLHKRMEKEQVKADKLGAPGLPLHDLIYKLVMPACRTLFNIEQHGFLVDLPYATALNKRMQQRQTQIGKEVRALPYVKQFEVSRAYDLLLRSPKAPKTEVGKTNAVRKLAFNPGSDDQIRAILFGDAYFNYPDDNLKLTPTGKVSIPKDLLVEIVGDMTEDTDMRKFCGFVLEHKNLQKKMGTYLSGVMDRTSAADSRVHPSFHQERATTGRLSCTGPNLQNIFDDQEIKRMFIVPPGYVLLSGDYSQIELRNLAMMSGDTAMIELFQSDYDIHDATARAVFELHEDEEVTKDQRREAKAVNFGIVYGQTPYGLGKSLGIAQDDAQEMISALYNRFPGIQDWQEAQIEFAVLNGFVYTMFGRRRIIENAKIKPRSKEESILQEEAFKQVVNAPIQGTASDMTLVSAIRLDRLLRKRKYKARIVNLVHDSIMVECHERYVDKTIALMKKVMLKEPTLWVGDQMHNVPIRVDFEIGPTWGDLEKLEAA